MHFREVVIKCRKREEIRHLKRELDIVRQERDILKKAIGIFSQRQD